MEAYNLVLGQKQRGREEEDGVCPPAVAVDAAVPVDEVEEIQIGRRCAEGAARHL